MYHPANAGAWLPSGPYQATSNCRQRVVSVGPGGAGDVSRQPRLSRNFAAMDPHVRWTPRHAQRRGACIRGGPEKSVVLLHHRWAEVARLGLHIHGRGFHLTGVATRSWLGRLARPQHLVVFGHLLRSSGDPVHGYPHKGRCNVTAPRDQLKAHWVSPSRAFVEKMQASSSSAARASSSAQPTMVSR